jgi:hypothetical protein
MDLRLARLKAVSFYLLYNVSTLNQCRKLSCVTVVCKHFASYQGYPNYRWELIRWANGTHQLLAYADDVNILGGSVHAVRENAEALVVATKEIGLEVNTDKTKYMIMSRDQNAGRGEGVKIDNRSIERVEVFKYLGATLTDQNSIKEEIKSRLKLGNACYYSVQNLLSSRLLS